MSEFELIERIRARAGSGASVVLGIGDDAAVVQPTAGHQLVLTTDSLVLDRHFTAAWPAADIGYLALAVNLSDLAAMAAIPRWAMLSLTLPEADPDWLDAFLDGFLGLSDETGICLVGGNMASGPLNIGVQALGEIETGQAARRDGARPGDVLAITGTPGDAAAALELGVDAPAELLQRLRRPTPRLAAGRALGPLVHAMIDVSDGLLADLAHLLGPGQGATIEVADLPTSPALRDSVADRTRWGYQLNGGSDYELLVALPTERFEAARQACREASLLLTPIGRVTMTGQVQCRLPDGQDMEPANGGWDHFKTG